MRLGLVPLDGAVLNAARQAKGDKCQVRHQQSRREDVLRYCKVALLPGTGGTCCLGSAPQGLSQGFPYRQGGNLWAQ